MFLTTVVLSATCQVALGVGIPLTFLLTAAITALLASFITYLCLNRMRTHTYSHLVPVMLSHRAIYLLFEAADTNTPVKQLDQSRMMENLSQDQSRVGGEERDIERGAQLERASITLLPLLHCTERVL